MMSQKLRVWCRVVHGQWGLGTILSTLGEEAVISLPNGNVSSLSCLTNILAPKVNFCKYTDLL